MDRGPKALPPSPGLHPSNCCQPSEFLRPVLQPCPQAGNTLKAHRARTICGPLTLGLQTTGGHRTQFEKCCSILCVPSSCWSYLYWFSFLIPSQSPFHPPLNQQDATGLPPASLPGAAQLRTGCSKVSVPSALRRPHGRDLYNEKAKAEEE